jgi:hypothetical protein
VTIKELVEEINNIGETADYEVVVSSEGCSSVSAKEIRGDREFISPFGMMPE